MRLVWDSNACEDCLWWQDHDRNVLKRINLLLQTSCTTATEGLGKPEPLGHDVAGYWSRPHHR